MTNSVRLEYFDWCFARKAVAAVSTWSDVFQELFPSLNSVNSSFERFLLPRKLALLLLPVQYGVNFVLCCSFCEVCAACVL